MSENFIFRFDLTLTPRQSGGVPGTSQIDLRVTFDETGLGRQFEYADALEVMTIKRSLHVAAEERTGLNVVHREINCFKHTPHTRMRCQIDVWQIDR
jgi:hypothetical protein